MKSILSRDLKRFNYLLGEIEAQYHKAALSMGLSDSALKILYAVYSEGNGCQLRDICRLSGLNKQTVNSALRKLEGQEILFLKPPGGRQKQVCFTEKGQKLAQATAGRVIAMENRIFEGWPQEKRQEYLRLTQEYLDAMKKEMERGLEKP